LNILLVEDSAELREEISAFLSRRGWSVLCAGSLQEFEALMDQAGLAIIDIMLPDGSGFDAITRLRQASPGAGIIALSARGSSDYVVQGLHDGADHYLVKPVKLIELEAVIVSLSRRVPTSWTLQSGARQLISPRGLALQLSRNVHPRAATRRAAGRSGFSPRHRPGLWRAVAELRPATHGYADQPPAQALPRYAE